MSFIVTPSQLERRAELYHQLGSLITAGVPIIQSLQQMQRHPPSYSFRQPISKIIAVLEQGYTFTDAMSMVGDWLPSFDLALLSAGEKSGRIDACCRLLAGYYRERALLARDVLKNLAYPVLLAHFALVVFPTSALSRLVWQGDVAGYLKTKLVILPVYAVVVLFIYASQSKHGEGWRSIIESIANRIPLLGSARRALALARLTAALEALINAGVSIFTAWELAAVASGSPALRKRVYSWRPHLDMGERPSELISRSPEFPELFANLYNSGEISGQQDDTLKRLHAYYQEEGSRKLQMVATWFPRLVYFGIVLAVAYQIISFYSGYFQQINDLTR